MKFEFASIMWGGRADTILTVICTCIMLYGRIAHLTIDKICT